MANSSIPSPRVGLGLPATPPPSDRPQREFTDEESAAFQERERERAAARDKLLGGLNDRQRDAVEFPDKSVLVLAGAGSGKTSVLTARITRLITKGTPPAGILAVTFTNKAAAEMRSRLYKLQDKRSVNEIWTGTFHSLCNKILRDNFEAAGLPKNFAILDTDGQESLARNILKDLGLTKSAVNEAKKLEDQLKTIDLFSGSDNQAPAPSGRDDFDDEDEYEFVTPAQCVKRINSRKEMGEKPIEVGTIHPRLPVDDQAEAVYAEYQKRIEQFGLLDFQDLLARAVDLLERDDRVREVYRNKFSAILVDEFQDTNDIQYRWLQLIKSPTAHVMAVGDDDQSIYAFRGANPKNMQLFVDEMTKDPKSAPNGAVVRLEQNYRSKPHILDAANALISRNRNRLGKNLFTSQPDDNELIEVSPHSNGIEEAKSIADNVNKLIKSDGVNPSEICILYRANTQSRTIEHELNKRGIPLTVYGGFRFYERQEIKFVLAYLDLISDISRDLSYAKVANFPDRGIGDRTMEGLRQQANQMHKSIAEVVAERADLRESNPKAIGNASALKKQLKLEAFNDLLFGLIKDADDLTLSGLIESVINRAGIIQHYETEAATSKSAAEECRERINNIMELVSAAKQFEIENPTLKHADAALPEYLTYISLMTSTSESDMSKKQTVSLMTVHSSKGLEFDHVHIAGLEEGTFPHSRSIESDSSADAMSGNDFTGEEGDALQEERRLMYVAITRARKTLSMSYCNEKLVAGQVKEYQPSRFLAELPSQRIDLVESLVQYKAKSDGRFTSARPTATTAARTFVPPNTSTKQFTHPRDAEVSNHKDAVTFPKEAPNPSANSFKADPQSRFSTGNTKSVGAPGASVMQRLASLGGLGSLAQARAQSAEKAPATTPEVAIKPQPQAANKARALQPTDGRVLAIIGSAGRDKQNPMTKTTWESMLADARQRVLPTDTLVSGGGAWSDHLSVMLYLEGAVANLVLHFPAGFKPGQFGSKFLGPLTESSASVANYYHEMFSKAIGRNTFGDLLSAINKGATFTTQPEQAGYRGLFERNSLVARDATDMLAYTFGAEDQPDSRGTQDTWGKFDGPGERQHVCISKLPPPPKADPVQQPVSERLKNIRLGAKTQQSKPAQAATFTPPAVAKPQAPSGTALADQESRSKAPTAPESQPPRSSVFRPR